MKLVQMNWHPGDQQLRQFGMISLLALPGIAWVWGASHDLMAVLLAVGVVFALTGIAKPQALRIPFVGLCLLTIPIGLVVSELTLLLMYLLVFLPIGGVFCLLRRDALSLRSQSAESYWKPRSKPASVASYYRQW
ncbi:MAG: SxtJ family membrane protein [Planctomycetota bacterium]|nr:SxtJ family membrane protein [Planctomycetota bacterium]MDA1252310.1 SxtJ family membrane protein [Planctomycetota bacterium]